MSNPKYIVRAAFSSFIIPIGICSWFLFTYEFVNYDGSPDNAPIRSLPGMLLLMVPVFLFQLAAYSALGKVIYRSKCFTLKHGARFTCWLSLPVPLIAVGVWVKVSGFEWASFNHALIVTLSSYVFLWLSFFTGALVQLRGITNALTRSLARWDNNT
jgi:hypothetical protein